MQRSTRVPLELVAAGAPDPDADAGGVRAERDRALARVRDLPARRLARADYRQWRQDGRGHRRGDI